MSQSTAAGKKNSQVFFTDFSESSPRTEGDVWEKDSFAVESNGYVFYKIFMILV